MLDDGLCHGCDELKWHDGPCKPAPATQHRVIPVEWHRVAVEPTDNAPARVERERVCAKCEEWIYYDNGDVTFHCGCNAHWKWRDVPAAQPATDEPTCHCGDYKSQHEDGIGKCRLWSCKCVSYRESASFCGWCSLPIVRNSNTSGYFQWLHAGTGEGPCGHCAFPANTDDRTADTIPDHDGYLPRTEAMKRIEVLEAALRKISVVEDRRSEICQCGHEQLDHGGDRHTLGCHVSPVGWAQCKCREFVKGRTFQE